MIAPELAEILKKLDCCRVRAEGARAMLLRLGTKNFGRPPTEEQQAVLDAIVDADRLEELDIQVQDVATWGEFLAGA